MIITVLTREVIAKSVYEDADFHIYDQTADGWMDEGINKQISPLLPSPSSPLSSTGL